MLFVIARKIRHVQKKKDTPQETRRIASANLPYPVSECKQVSDASSFIRDSNLPQIRVEIFDMLGFFCFKEFLLKTNR